MIPMFESNYENMFAIVGVLSILGWSALAFSPFRQATLILIARIISILLALIYTYLLISLWGHEPKVDFSTLAGVSSGFSFMGHLLTGWIHFLALDLFIGAWLVEKAIKIGMPHIVVLPCLILTFLVGPLGLLLFLLLQSIKVRTIKMSQRTVF